MAILLIFVLLFFGGIMIGDWALIILGGMPFLCGIVAYVLMKIGEDKLEDEMEKNPEVREIVKDIETQKKKLGW